jgi:hypothetical protein
VFWGFTKEYKCFYYGIWLFLLKQSPVKMVDFALLTFCNTKFDKNVFANNLFDKNVFAYNLFTVAYLQFVY